MIDHERKVLICKGCGKEDDISDWNVIGDTIKYHDWSRRDWYGIFTGIYCGDCYDDSSKYPYRKERYPTKEWDGYGEQLEDDY